jgi:hypothetical protein
MTCIVLIIALVLQVEERCFKTTTRDAFVLDVSMHLSGRRGGVVSRVEVGGWREFSNIRDWTNFILHRHKTLLDKQGSEAEAASNGCVQCLRFWPRRQKAVITSNKWGY